MKRVNAGRCLCGGVILADTEDWETPLCHECWVPYTRLDIPRLVSDSCWLKDFAMGIGKAILEMLVKQGDELGLRHMQKEIEKIEKMGL